MRAALLSLIALTALGAAVSANGGRSALPPISLEGIGGVRPGTPLQTVRKTWHLRLPTVVQAPGSEAFAYAPICVGAVRGVVELEGPNETKGLERDLLFNWAVFTAGVETTATIHIGSSASDVRRAYGRRLRGDLRHDELRIISPKAPRATIVFEFDGDRVSAIGYGRRGAVDMHTWRASC